MKWRACLAWMLVVLLVPLGAFAQTEFDVILTVQPETVPYLQQVKANATARGAVPPVSYTFNWYCTEDKEAYWIFEETNTTGISVLPKAFGEYGWAEVTAEDAQGNWGTWQMADFTVTGGQSNPLQCSVQADRQAINVGETVTGTATVTGGTPPYTYYHIWDITEQNETHRFQRVKSTRETNAQTIPYGERGAYWIEVVDGVGRTGYAEFPAGFTIANAQINLAICARPG